MSHVTKGGGARFVEDEVDFGGQIFRAHVFEVEIPESFGILNGIQGGVSDAVLAAAVVAHPHVEALAGQVEGTCLLGGVYHPLDSVALQAVLEKDRRLALRRLGFVQEARNAEEGQDVAVGSGHLVLFVLEAVLIADLLHALEGVVVRVTVQVAPVAVHINGVQERAAPLMGEDCQRAQQ